MVLEKVNYFDEFLQDLEIESKRHASENRGNFVFSSEEFQVFIGISFVMGYNKLPTLQSHYEEEISSVSVSFVVERMMNMGCDEKRNI